MLANGVIESVHFEPFVPERVPDAAASTSFSSATSPLRELTDEQLTKLSREGHLFLSLAEMKAIQAYFREQGREPTDIELETLAQTWSEHCVHKTLKSAVDVEVRDADGQARRQPALRQPDQGDDLRQHDGADAAERGRGKPISASRVFKDNAGVVAFDETDAVCFKVETHNHPSAIEPYGGSATGIGGVIRDILGTGLAAKPVANTDVFCVAFPDAASGVGPCPTPDPAPLPQRASSIPSASSSRSWPACATTATAWASPPSTGPSTSTTATSATRWSSAAASA